MARPLVSPRLDRLIIPNVVREAVRAFADRFAASAVMLGVEPGRVSEDACPLSLALNRFGTWARDGGPYPLSGAPLPLAMDIFTARRVERDLRPPPASELGVLLGAARARALLAECRPVAVADLAALASVGPRRVRQLLDGGCLVRVGSSTRRDALLEPVSTVVWLHEVGVAGFEVVLK
jgi:hypothetical protein